MPVRNSAGPGSSSSSCLCLTGTAEGSGASVWFSRCKPEGPALFPLLHSSLYYDLHFCILLVTQTLPEVELAALRLNSSSSDGSPVAAQAPRSQHGAALPVCVPT